MKHIYMWYDGDVKRFYFSSKTKYLKWIRKFAKEFKSMENDKRTIAEIIQHFSNPFYLTKLEVDL